MSQRRSNNRSSRAAVADEEELDSHTQEAVKECVRFIICREGSKIPIKRAELLKHLNQVCETPNNQVNRILLESNKILKRVYGYKLIQVEAKSGVQYIMVLTEDCDSLQSTISDNQQRRLLIAALLHIFMSGGSVKEDEMWKFLAEAGLLEENNHAGRKVLTQTFTRQMYLLFTKKNFQCSLEGVADRDAAITLEFRYRVGDGDLARNIFEWGQRATEEVPKLFLLNKMAEAFEKTPDHWCEQYRNATEERAE